MKSITVRSSEGYEDYKIPQSWSEVTVGQYQKIVQTTDLITVFSILCDKDYKTLSNRVNPDLERTLFDCVRFVSEQAFKAFEVPKVLTIDGKDLIIPKRIGGLSIGQSIHVREKLESCKVYEECISMAVACYLQPIYHRTEFDFDKALELERVILKMPITKIYPVGFFLLKPLTKTGNNILRDLCLTLAQWYLRSMRSAETLLRWLRFKDSNHSNI